MNRIFACILGSVISLTATTINIPSDQPTIQAGINASVNGDTVLVQPGTYFENVNYNGKNIVLGSQTLFTHDTSYTSQTIIDGGQAGSVVTFGSAEDSTAVLIGFTIRNGRAANGGGVICYNTSPQIVRCKILGNTATNHGGGLYFTYNAQARIENCLIEGNTAAYGGGIYCEINSDIKITDVVISGNIANVWGGGFYCTAANPLFNRVLVDGNSAAIWGGIYFHGTEDTETFMNNVTIVNNYADSGGALLVSHSTTILTANNCVIWGNSPSQVQVVGEDLTFTINYSDVQNGWEGIGNIDSDPIFVDPLNGDFHLDEESSCIDSGNPDLDGDGDLWGIDSDDQDPDGTRLDMGAYYHHFPRYTGPIWHVATDGSDEAGDGSHESPFATFQFGIEASSDGDTVLVRPGTYVENINFNGKNIVAGSLFLTTQDTSYISQTVIDGNQNGSVITFSNVDGTSPVLNGFSITNGVADNGGGIAVGLVGSDFSSSVQLQNLRIYGNTASTRGGGIIFWQGRPVVNNVLIYNNYAGNSGGAISDNASNMVLTNAVLVNNSTGSLGGAILCDLSSPTLNYVTIIGNTADEGGGLHILHDSNLLLINSILWNNTPDQISYRSYNQPSTSTVTYSTVENGVDGIVTNNNGSVFWQSGNNNVYPVFVDSANGDYHLSDTSPCIGSGADSVQIGSIWYHAPVTDLDGNPRPNPTGSTPDMGAYENSLASPQHIPGTINIPNDYATIQAGLNAAESADTVLVQPGTYYENIIWPETNGIKLISAGDSSNTIIDGSANGRVIHMAPTTVLIDNATVIEGFNLKNGGNISNGAGIHITSASPKLIDLSITENITSHAIFMDYSSATLESCNVSDNSHGIDISGGASTPILNNVTVRNNGSRGISMGGWITPELNNVTIEGNQGGGIYILGCNPTMTNIVVINNSSWDTGGGIYIRNSDATISGSTISGNTSHHNGGGIWMYDSNPNISGTTITENTSEGDGGGIYMTGWSYVPVLEDLIITGNVANGGNGGGINSDGCFPILSNVIISENSCIDGSGGGAYFSGQASLTMVDVISNTAALGGGLWIHGSLTINGGNICNNSSIWGGGGVYCQYGSQFNGVTFSGNTAYRGGGVNGSMTIANSTFANNLAAESGNAIYGNPTISYSNITNNGTGLIDPDNNYFLPATNNYWGHHSGPYNSIQNPSGLGDSTSSYVNVAPWLESPDTDAPPIPAQNLIVNNTGIDFINLSWDSSLLDDFANFKLYYDTDSSGYPYSNSIDLDVDTSYTFAGLSPGVVYYLAVTVLDTVGNESWYSSELQVTPQLAPIISVTPTLI
ncbi:MAG: hypothetical protein HOE61_07115, partial [Candidatus Marinimicrobia bacterium]|nr:hypothetical protein [Candidatus Neomarinimicrobiota bacterium]